MQGVGIIYHREIGTCTSNYRFWLRGVNSDGSEVGPIWWVFAATLTVFLRQFRLTVTVPRRLVRTRRLFRFLHVCQYVSTFYWHNLVFLIIILTRISNSFPLATLLCTEVHFASFLSGLFITTIVVNPEERKLEKRTSAQWRVFNNYSFCQKHSTFINFRKFWVILW